MIVWAAMEGDAVVELFTTEILAKEFLDGYTQYLNKKNCNVKKFYVRDGSVAWTTTTPPAQWLKRESK